MNIQKRSSVSLIVFYFIILALGGQKVMANSGLASPTNVIAQAQVTDFNQFPKGEISTMQARIRSEPDTSQSNIVDSLTYGVEITIVDISEEGSEYDGSKTWYRFKSSFWRNGKQETLEGWIHASFVDVYGNLSVEQLREAIQQAKFSPPSVENIESNVIRVGRLSGDTTIIHPGAGPYPEYQFTEHLRNDLNRSRMAVKAELSLNPGEIGSVIAWNGENNYNWRHGVIAFEYEGEQITRIFWPMNEDKTLKNNPGASESELTNHHVIDIPEEAKVGYEFSDGNENVYLVLVGPGGYELGKYDISTKSWLLHDKAPEGFGQEMLDQILSDELSVNDFELVDLDEIYKDPNLFVPSQVAYGRGLNQEIIDWMLQGTEFDRTVKQLYRLPGEPVKDIVRSTGYSLGNFSDDDSWIEFSARYVGALEPETYKQFNYPFSLENQQKILVMEVIHPETGVQNYIPIFAPAVDSGMMTDGIMVDGSIGDYILNENGRGQGVHKYRIDTEYTYADIINQVMASEPGTQYYITYLVDERNPGMELVKDMARALIYGDPVGDWFFMHFINRSEWMIHP